MFSVFQVQILPKGGTINVADEEFCTKYKKISQSDTLYFYR